MKYLFIAEKPSLMRDVQACYRNHRQEVTEKIGEIDFTALSGHVCTNYMPTDYEEWTEKSWTFQRSQKRFTMKICAEVKGIPISKIFGRKKEA